MRVGFDRLESREALILGGLFALALLLRGWALGLRPAAPEEAAQAWAAWRGGVLPPGGSPLLAGWNATAFAIFGPDEGWMRSGAALASALGAVALWAILRPVGLAGSIVAAWLWALSPTALMAGRFLDGGAVAAMALAVALACWRSAHPARWIGIGVALGIGAAAGPAFWTGCLMLFPLLWVDPPEASFPRWRTLGLFGIVAFMAGAWGGWRASGARETVEGLSAWLAGFAPESLPMGWEAIGVFLRGEAVVLALGLSGGIQAIRRQDRFGTALIAGAGVGIGLMLLRFGASLGERAVMLIPWVALAGFAAQWVWDAVEPVWRRRRGAVLGAFAVGGIGLGTVALFMSLRVGTAEARWLVLGGVLGLLALGAWMLGGLLEDEADSSARAGPPSTGLWPGSGWGHPALVGIAGALAVAVALGQIAGATALAQRVDPVPGLSLPEMTHPAVRAAVEVLQEEAARQRGWPGRLSVVVVTGAEEAFWRWILRGFEVAVYQSPPALEIGDVWITPEGMPVPLAPDRWVGRPFPALVDQRGTTPVERRMVLWVRVSEEPVLRPDRAIIRIRFPTLGGA